MATIAPELVVFSQPTSEAAEQFRRLRTNVQFAEVDRPLRTVSLVAVHSHSGKSVIAANLAAAFGQAGRQTILIDADLLHPTQHMLFETAMDPGLADVVIGRAPVADCLITTGVPLVRLLPVGTMQDNPALILNSPRLHTMISELTEFADIIVIDTPALDLLTDTALFAAKSDGTLLVIDSGYTHRQDAMAAKELLERVHANVLGAVIGHPHSSTSFIRRLFGAA